jgi:hypothetical protein
MTTAERRESGALAPIDTTKSTLAGSIMSSCSARYFGDDSSCEALRERPPRNRRSVGGVIGALKNIGAAPRSDNENYDLPALGAFAA